MDLLEGDVDLTTNLFLKKNHAPQIWAIGGGKGGVGKSFVSSSLAICAARMGHKVTLVDLDFGGANLHTCLGAAMPSLSLSDFLTQRVGSLEQLCHPTPQANLQFISGSNDALNAGDLSDQHQVTLTKGLLSLSSQVIILDLGAGTSQKTLDFFVMAHRKVVVVTPEPTSVENAYRFIKAAFYRQLRLSEKDSGVSHIVEAAMDHKNSLGIRSPADLIRHVQAVDPMAGARFAQAMHSFWLDLVINQTRSRADQALGPSIKSICQKYFGIESNYLGHIDHDNAVWQALRKKRPALLEFPHSQVVSQCTSLTRNLLDRKTLKAVI